MAEQITCLQCGGTQVSVKSRALDPASGKPTVVWLALIAGGGAVAFGACMLLGGIGVAISTKMWAALFLYLGVGALFLVPGALGVRKYLRAVKVREFKCADCGHQWMRLKNAKKAVSCPSCGSTEAFQDTFTANRQNGDRVVLWSTILWGIFAVVLIGGTLWMAIMIWAEGDDGMIRWEYGSTLAGIGVLSTGIAFGRFGVIAVINYFKAERTKLSMGHCLACGYQWKQWAGEELQPVGDSVPDQPSQDAE